MQAVNIKELTKGTYTFQTEKDEIVEVERFEKGWTTRRYRFNASVECVAYMENGDVLELWYERE